MKTEFKHLLIILALSVSLTSCKNMMDLLSASVGKGASIEDMFGPSAPPSIGVPKAFRASRARYADKVHVSWDAVAGADYYVLEKGTSENGPFYDVGTKQYGLSWEDTSLADGEKAWYRLRAYSRRLEMFSGYTDPSCGLLLARPGGVSATKGISTQHIRLSWNIVEGAGGYEIYKSNNSAAVPNNPVKTVTGIENSTIIRIREQDQGRELFFWVKSTNSSGERSAASNFSMGFVLHKGAPPKPTNSTASQGAAVDSISLTWEANGADYYYVFRWSSYNGQEENITPEGLTVPAYTDSDMDSLRPGARYYYGIQAVKRDEADSGIVYKSAFSDTAEGYLLSPPSDLDSTWNGANNVDISWTGVPGAKTVEELARHGAWRYRVEYAGSLTGPFSTLEEFSVRDDGNGRVRYQHVGAAAPVFYRVITLNEADVASAASAPDEPVTAAVDGLSVSRNQAPQAGQTPNPKGIYPVSLSWNRPAGAVSFRVERASSENGNYIPLGAVANTSYVDSRNDRELKKNYFYRIIPLNSLDKAGPVCPSISGYGSLTDEVFLKTFNTDMALSSRSKLTLMHKGGLSALGSEDRDGSISGTVSYSASGGLSGATVIMKYTNYCDVRDNLNQPVFVGTGNSDTIITDVISQIGYMRGTITVTGMYTGTVAYGGIQISGGAAAGGRYTVTQTGRPAVNLDWTVLR